MSRRSGTAAAGWTVIVPFKGGAAAKSRLGLPPAQGADLARAIAADCLTAVHACPDVAVVVVVTPDQAVADLARRAGARVVPESRPGAGLRPAITDGIRSAPPTEATAVLLGDLPALRPQDLTVTFAAVTVLLTAGAGQVAVPDAAGAGTVLLAAAAPDRLHPAFGPDSLRAHQDQGAVSLAGAPPRLRQDVDTPADLALARHLGVGPHTAEWLRHNEEQWTGQPRRVSGVQATVHEYDAHRGHGRVVTDDGRVLSFPVDVLRAGPLRLVRVGQRVTLTLAPGTAEPQITGITVAGLGGQPRA